MTGAIFQCDFPFSGPWGAEMAATYNELAEDIGSEEGLVWKIWTENAAEQRAGGIYLFTSLAEARRYACMHTERLTSLGVKNVVGRLFDINEGLSAITRAPLAVLSRSKST